ncbi:hypothetical protein CVT24_000283 [Panaeolus cyanescens]|uniref:RNase H type-1 domain-containing protein n=1 Tax=Panaeolus cyanescens TaxID=181874 RepID=A0A409X865_9AGAR|nr:hypothetical protein CVT24_000283 [Panaeolus cyanescens]
MHLFAPDGFSKREPGARQILRVPKTPIGIHEPWAADGHDKLNKIGFPIWALVDDATGKWLGAWIVPNNRDPNIVSYCFLETVLKYKGYRLRVREVRERETTVDWERGRRAERQDIYTDGSMTDGGVASAAVWMKRGEEKMRRTLRIGETDEHTVYEAELMGITLAMEIAQEHRFKGKIHIGLDNQAVLTTIKTRSPKFAQKMWEDLGRLIKTYLKRDPTNEVEFRWTPGHEGFEGNERADGAARGAAEEERRMGGEEEEEEEGWEDGRMVPISRAATRQRLMKEIGEKRRDMWKNSTRYDRMQGFDDTMPSKIFGRLTKSLRRKQASVIFQLRTGHVQLAKHLYTMGKEESPMCKGCGRRPETVYHYIMECERYETARRRHFAYMGRNQRTMTRLLKEEKLLPKLFSYINDTKRLKRLFGTFDTG